MHLVVRSQQPMCQQVLLVMPGCMCGMHAIVHRALQYVAPMHQQLWPRTCAYCAPTCGATSSYPGAGLAAGPGGPGGAWLGPPDHLRMVCSCVGTATMRRLRLLSSTASRTMRYTRGGPLAARREGGLAEICHAHSGMPNGVVDMGRACLGAGPRCWLLSGLPSGRTWWRGRGRGCSRSGCAPSPHHAPRVGSMQPSTAWLPVMRVITHIPYMLHMQRHWYGYIYRAARTCTMPHCLDTAAMTALSTMHMAASR